jgi:hypothetical protein
MPTIPTEDCSDAELAKSMAKLWPNSLHESSALKNLLCHLGLHRWAQLNVENLLPEKKEIRFCRWCSRVKVDGVIYDP